MVKKEIQVGDEVKVLAVDRSDVEAGVASGMVVTVIRKVPDDNVYKVRLPDARVVYLYGYDLELATPRA